MCARDGYDYDTENYIEINNQDSVISGNGIETCDYSDDSYREVYVISVNHNGAVIVEVFE